MGLSTADWCLSTTSFKLKIKCIPKRKKLGKGGKRPKWMSKELMDKLKGKKKVHEMWKKPVHLGRI